MKAAIIFACLLAVAFARPNPETETLKLQSKDGSESYTLTLETSDATKKDQSGQLKDIGTDQDPIVVNGSFSWVDEMTGDKFTINYVRGDKGGKGADVA